MTTENKNQIKGKNDQKQVKERAGVTGSERRSVFLLSYLLLGRVQPILAVSRAGEGATG